MYDSHLSPTKNICTFSEGEGLHNGKCRCCLSIVCELDKAWKKIFFALWNRHRPKWENSVNTYCSLLKRKECQAMLPPVAFFLEKQERNSSAAVQSSAECYLYISLSVQWVNIHFHSLPSSHFMTEFHTPVSSRLGRLHQPQVTCDQLSCYLIQ